MIYPRYLFSQMVEKTDAVGVSGTSEFDSTARFRVKNNSIVGAKIEHCMDCRQVTIHEIPSREMSSRGMMIDRRLVSGQCRSKKAQKARKMTCGKESVPLPCGKIVRSTDVLEMRAPRRE